MGDSAEMERAEVRGCFRGCKEEPSITQHNIFLFGCMPSL